MRDSYTNRMNIIREKTSAKESSTPSSMTPYKNKSMNLQINTNRTSKEHSSVVRSNNTTHRSTNERLNLSVDITSKKVNH